MRRIAHCTLAGLLAAAIFGGAARTQAQSKNEQEIRALEDRFAAAFNAKDVDAIMKCYVTGNELFVFDLGLPRQHVGWEDYKKDWQDFLARMKGPIQFDIHDLRVTYDGNLAYSHSLQHVKWTSTDGTPMDYTVRVTDDYRKIGEKWLIVQEHISVPIDFSGPKPAPDLNSRP
jgi:ketosteroid isomerase-like protein